MAQRKRGLGRGLESLLSKDFDEQGPESAALFEVPLDGLVPGRYQPRRDMDSDALEALAQSIRSQGIVQPLVVRETGDGYEIVAGERRWRAARLAGLTTVPVVTRNLPDQTAMAVALIENIQREDLNPLEESTALRRLIDECGLTHAACAEAVGRSRAAVSNLLRLADLNADVHEHLRSGALEMGHARALLALTGDEQSDMAHQVVVHRLTVRQTEERIRRLLAGESDEKTSTNRNAELDRQATTLAERLQSKVRIEPDKRGGGRMIISFRSQEELDTLMGRID